MIAITVTADTHLDALAPGVLVVHPADSGPICLHLPPATVTALVALTDGPVPVADVPSDEPSRAAMLRLARAGVLHFSVVVDRREALRATLTGALSRYDGSVCPGDPAVRLSRFALLRRHGDEFVMDAPAVGARIAVQDRRALTIIGELARPRTVAQLNTALLDCSPQLIECTVRLLMGVGVAAEVDDDGLLAEDRHPVLRRRELPDVLLHAASRGGLGDRPVDVAAEAVDTAPVTSTGQPVAPAQPDAPARRIPLTRPDPAVLRAGDPPLAAVMEDVCGAKGPDRQPVTAAQLGEFLFRVARAWPTRPDGVAQPHDWGSGSSPADAGTELDFYLSVLDCPGLIDGIFHYQPVSHALALVNGDRPAVRRMLADAQRAAGAEGSPEILVTLAVRWDRWHRRGIGYAAALKHVGIRYATMQLAAAAMGLTGRPLDVGDAALFAEVTGRDPTVGSSVGEFLLGGRPRA